MRTKGFEPGVNGIPSTSPTCLIATPQALWFKHIDGVKIPSTKEFYEEFLLLLLNGCKDQDLGSPSENAFWETFAASLNRKLEMELTGNTCRQLFKYIQGYYEPFKDSNMTRIYKSMAAYLNKLKPLVAQILKDYGHLFPPDEVPDTPEHTLQQTSLTTGSMQPTETFLEPGLEAKIFYVLDEMVNENLVDLDDVITLQEHFSRSTWAMSMFLRQKEGEKRLKLINRVLDKKRKRSD